MSELAKALSAAQKAFPIIPKRKTAVVKTKAGGEFRYKYADLADVLSAVIPALSANGLAFSQPFRQRDGKTYVTSRLLHASGEVLESDGIQVSAGLSPQELGSEITYYRRYDGCALLGIAPDEDEDAGASSAAHKADAKASPRAGEAKPVPAQAESALISEAQAKRLWTIARDLAWPEVAIRDLLGSHGFEHTREITKVAYRKIMEDLQASKPRKP